MHEMLTQVRLANGETLKIFVIQAPDEEHAGTVLNLLSHKGELRQWQFQEDFAGRTLSLRSRYYLGFIQGRAVANIVVWESGVTGNLGHVYTAEAHRRKGICRAVMTAQMDDFRQRGGRFLVLGTGYDSHPYHIYSSFGFASMLPKSGSMFYLREPTFFEDFYVPGNARCGTVQWSDLATVCALMALPRGDWLRSKGMQKLGPTCYEAAFLQDMQELLRDRLQARVARLESGAVTAYAVLRPSAEWAGQSGLLDLFVHPDFAGCVEDLLAGFAWPEKTVRCYLDAESRALDGLRSAGFAEEARLANALRREEDAIDVLIMSRSG